MKRERRSDDETGERPRFSDTLLDERRKRMRVKDRQVVGYLLVIFVIAAVGSVIYAAVLILGGTKWARRVDVASPWLGFAFAVFALSRIWPGRRR